MKILNDIQVGDKVIVGSHLYNIICEVAHVTKTQIHLKDGRKFRKSDGLKINRADKYDCTRIYTLTPDMEKQIMDKQERNSLVNEIKRMPFDKLSIEQLRSIIEIVNDKKTK